MREPKVIWIVAAVVLLATPAAHAASARHLSSVRPLASNLVIPQRRSFSVDTPQPVKITRVIVGVKIVQQAAVTTMDISLSNPSNRRQEAELIVPVPDGAVVRGFAFEGAAKEPTAEILRKDEAREIYDRIVAKIRDPALLEFVGYNLIRSSVFPVDANGKQKVRLTYEHLLPADGDRVDYVLPRSEALDYTVPWRVSVRIKCKRAISTVYSPSHKIETTRTGKNVVSARIADDATTEPGAFRLSYLLEQGGVSASLFAYPDPKVGGGYFLLLAGLPAKPKKTANGPAIKREITLVLDRSGSMNGEKIEQVREAALQVVAGLEKGEAFNIIAYNEHVDMFADKPVLKTKASVEAARKYLAGINARGGTNIHDALLEALRQKPMKDMLPIVLFLTDGLPTVGQTSEVAIRNVAIKANPHNRRIFTFGVGLDVNTPLLTKIAIETRATSAFVLPKEDVEVKVAQVFKRLQGPILAEPELVFVDAKGEPAPGSVRDVIPHKLADMFEGDQLVLLGQYVDEKPLNFRLSGNYLGKQRSFKFSFDLDNATTKNGFVPRLWASRKIAALIDIIRDSGADIATAQTQGAVTVDPKLKELVEEIVRLSTEFGILTEYTAFLAREGTDLNDRDNVLSQAWRNFDNRARTTRGGLGSLNQDINNDFQRRQNLANSRNKFYDEKMNRVSIVTVQQINDQAFYQRGRRWVDSRLVNDEREIKPKTVIEFGSEDFRKLATRLAADGRQGSIALRGDILLVVDNEPVLIKAPASK